MSALERRSAALVLLALSVFGPSASSAAASPAIYPSGTTVPENLLRVELRFPQALRRPLRPEDVRLLDSAGRQIADAFLDLPLPSADGKRVTLLLHPGRVKTGVGPNVRVGRAFESGATVRLEVVDPGSARRVSRSWQVTAFEAGGPAPSRWTLEIPQAGSRVPLIAHLNHAISSTAESLIAIRGPDGRRVSGVAALADGETTWRFRPAQRWGVGSFDLMIHPDLEDLGGNRACARFEQPPSTPVNCEEGTTTPFRIRLSAP